MSPLIMQGDKLIYRRKGERTKYAVGQVVMFRCTRTTSSLKPARLLLGRIMAVPGDKIIAASWSTTSTAWSTASWRPTSRIRLHSKSRGSQRDGGARRLLLRDSGCPDGGLDSRVISWARADDSLVTKLYLIRGGPPWPRVE